MTAFTTSTTNYPSGADTPIRRVIASRAPTTTDNKNFILGDEWLDKSTYTWYKLNNATATEATWTAIQSSSSGITEINGDSGTTTDTSISLLATATAGSSVSFDATAAEIVLNVTDDNNNTFYGLNSGSSTAVNGSANTGIGYSSLGSLNGSLTTGNNNTGCGYGTLAACTTGVGNVAVGYNSMVIATTAQSNVGVGTGAIVSLSTGQSNTAIGNNLLS